MATAAALTPLVSPLGHAQRARDVVPDVVSDEVLFLKARGGDRDALGTLIGRYEKTLFGLLVRLTNGDKHRADDFFQETFLHAMRAAATFNGQRQFKPWVTAIAVNLVRDEARKRKVRGEVALEGGAPDGEERRGALAETAAVIDDPADSAERKDEEAVVRKAMERLTLLEREVVLLHFFNSMTLVETAESLEVPLGTVKSRLHAALTRLSGMLQKPKP